MTEWLAGNVMEFDNGERKIVTIGGREVVVFRWHFLYSELFGRQPAVTCHSATWST